MIADLTKSANDDTARFNILAEQWREDRNRPAISQLSDRINGSPKRMTSHY